VRIVPPPGLFVLVSITAAVISQPETLSRNSPFGFPNAANATAHLTDGNGAAAMPFLSAWISFGDGSGAGADGRFLRQSRQP
jgi:hypothetical protein